MNYLILNMVLRDASASNNDSVYNVYNVGNVDKVDKVVRLTRLTRG